MFFEYIKYDNIQLLLCSPQFDYFVVTREREVISNSSPQRPEKGTYIGQCARGRQFNSRKTKEEKFLFPFSLGWLGLTINLDCLARLETILGLNPVTEGELERYLP